MLIVPFISTKEVETETEEFECIANYLRDKGVLEKGFTYFVQNKPLDCETYLLEKKEEWLNVTIREMIEPESEEEDEETINFKEMYFSNPICFHEQLRSLNFVNVIMKTLIYTKSNKLRERQRKKFLANVHNENVKKILIASSICFPDKLFGSTFDEIFASPKDDNATLDDKLSDYCIRKYVIDNNLIDTSAHNVSLNPENLEIVPDFDCNDTLKTSFDDLITTLTSSFVLEGRLQPESQIFCMTKIIREKDATNFMSRLSVLNELNLSNEEKLVEKSKYIDFMAKLYVELAKCM